MAEQTYQRLKTNFPKWENVLESSPSKLRAVLKPAGLSRKKSQQIRSLLRKVKGDFGKCSLDVVEQWQDSEIHEYLTTLAGVSDKVAKCVMLYTLSSDVLPAQLPINPSRLKSKGIKADELRKYAKVYRWFPSFAEVEM